MAWLLERYGEDIEADLRRCYGVDLLDLWRGTISPRAVLSLVDRLPRASRLRQAQSLDEDLAEMQAGHTADEADVPMSEWTLEAEVLVYMADVLGELLAVQIAKASQSGRVRHPRPLPRPKRALDEVLRRKAASQADELMRDIEEAQARGTLDGPA